MRVIEGGVTSPEGYLLQDLHAELKRCQEGFGYCIPEDISAAAGVFTTNIRKVILFR